MMLSVLTERRVHCPPGLEGGHPGARGRNTLKRKDDRAINLGPKTAVAVYPGVIKIYCASYFSHSNIIQVRDCVFVNNSHAFITMLFS